MASANRTEKTPENQGEWIGEYYVREPLTNKGAGFSVWGFGEKNGVRYFLKEYLTPVYPDESSGLSESKRQRRIKRCADFARDKFKLFQILNLSSDGNLLKVSEFFRFKTKYYIAAEAISGEPLPPPPGYLDDQTAVILLALAHAVMCFHKNGLVHGDIKPDNILYRRSRAGYLAPIVIDVDSCFYKANPPRDGDDLVVDQMFMSPETFRFIRGEDLVLDEKIDVFALGLIFHQIITGFLPGTGAEGRVYPFSVLLEGGQLDTSAIPDPAIRGLIDRMLLLSPADRISMAEVHDSLLRIFGRVEVTDPSGSSGGGMMDASSMSQDVISQELREKFWQVAGKL